MLATGIYAAVLGMALPYVAVYLAQHFSAGVALIGGITTAVGLVSLPAQLGGGHLSDRWGRRHLIVAGALSAMTGSVGLAVAPNLVVASGALVLLGASLALLLPVSQAMTADLAAPLARERAFARVYASIGAGWALGTLLGGWAASHSYRLLFGASAGLCIVAVAAAVALNETSSIDRKSAGPGVKNVWQDKRVLLLGSLVFSVWLIGGQLLVTVPLWVVGKLGYPALMFGLMMGINGVLIAGGQVLLTRFAIRLRPMTALALGCVVYGAGFGLLGFNRPAVLIMGAVVLTLGEMLLVPTTNAALDWLAPHGRRGQYQGAGALMQNLGLTIGPLIGGLLLQSFGGQMLWLVCFGWGSLSAAGYLAYDHWKPVRRPALP